MTEANLGAWVLRCNPLLSDPAELFRNGPITRWCVASNYRSRLMEPGQSVLFWITGSRPAVYERGFWGSGRITGRVFTEPNGAPADHDKLNAPMRIERFDHPLPAAVVAAVDGLADIEILRQPQMSNPSFLTVGQFNCLEPLLPANAQPS